MTKTNHLQDELNRLAVNASQFPQDSAFAQYVGWLNTLLEQPDPLFQRDYLPIIKENADRDHTADPFLTIITRTRGNRPEMLQETLLSLVAQTDEDFELLLIGHKVSPEQDAQLQEIIAMQPPALRQKIRYLTLDHGSRTTPINFGFAHARGTYVAVLDDDDIVFDNYVEAFHNAASGSNGKLLHAYVLLQPWRTLETDGGTALYSAGAPHPFYCRDFHMVHQFEENYCPLMGLAFPAVYFQKLGIIFDESCDLREDWDYTMRLAPLAGVTDITEPTAIYRIWENAENSKALHDEKAWEENYAVLSEKFRQMPVLIPQGMEKYYPHEPAPQLSLRSALKNRLRQAIPAPLLPPARAAYRMLRGKK